MSTPESTIATLVLTNVLNIFNDIEYREALKAHYAKAGIDDLQATDLQYYKLIKKADTHLERKALLLKHAYSDQSLFNHPDMPKFLMNLDLAFGCEKRRLRWVKRLARRPNDKGVGLLLGFFERADDYARVMKENAELIKEVASVRKENARLAEANRYLRPEFKIDAKTSGEFKCRLHTDTEEASKKREEQLKEFIKKTQDQAKKEEEDAPKRRIHIFTFSTSDKDTHHRAGFDTSKES